jgi:hypothetical protein
MDMPRVPIATSPGRVVRAPCAGCDGMLSKLGRVNREGLVRAPGDIDCPEPTLLPFGETGLLLSGHGSALNKQQTNKSYTAVRSYLLFVRCLSGWDTVAVATN